MSGPDQEIQVRRKLPRFGQVPDAVLEDRSISLEARAVVAYLVGRSDGFRISVGRLCFVLGIKDSRWRRIRQEMEAARYFLQTRHHSADGTFWWTNEVFDVPYDPATIPPKSTDGQPTGGDAIHGKPTDLPEGVLHTDSTIAREGAAKPPPTRAGARALSGGGQRYDVTPDGIHHVPGNEDDAAALARISTFPTEQVKQAVRQAAQSEARGRAFPTAVLRILLRQSAAGGGEQAKLDEYLASLAHAPREEAASPDAATSDEEKVLDGVYLVMED